jgi:hypothetical protein
MQALKMEVKERSDQAGKFPPRAPCSGLFSSCVVWCVRGFACLRLSWLGPAQACQPG